MPASTSVTRRANKATAGDLAVSVQPTRSICDRNFSFSVKLALELRDDERDQIWRMFEENMHELYHASSFGWNPLEKRGEMFHTLSRLVIVCDISDTGSDSAGPGIVAYCIFRFEKEDHQNVVYCYELQVSKDYRRFGLGTSLMQTLSNIGAQWGMTKIMLTVFKANHAAQSFYKSVGFTVDETSPNFPDDPKGEGVEEYDYSVLSRCLL